MAAFKQQRAPKKPDNPFEGLSLLDFIPVLSPEYQRPEHLVEWCEQFERIARGEQVRALCACPIQHGKSECTMHGIVWLLLKDPCKKYLLLTYSHERAVSLGKRTRQLAQAAGIHIAEGFNTIEDWQTVERGGVMVMSADQSKLGERVDAVIFDDPLDEHKAFDKRKRDEVDATIDHYTARTAVHNGSVLGVMSRWHPDDVIGRRLVRRAVTWEYIHNPAIIDEGLPTERAFAPKLRTLETLKKLRAEKREADPEERVWWAQFMGNPKPIGTAKFRPDPARYVTLPDWSFRLAYGVDLAYTSGEGSDYFALVVMKVYGRKAYIIEVQRTKLDAHMIESQCKAALARYGHGPIYTYVSGPEVGMVKLMRERGLPMQPMRARYNKLVRAERTIKRWNDEDIILPESAPWLSGFLRRAELFQGLDKGHDDDEIDALVSVCDGAIGGVVAGTVKTLGQAYAGFGAVGERR